MVRVSLDNPAFYSNREASWLAFDRRVLEEADDPSNPLLERVKFLAISASNLDEFFEVRLASLLQKIEDGHAEVGMDGRTPEQERELLIPGVHDLVEDQYACWNERLRPALAARGIRVLGVDELDSEGHQFVGRYCRQELDPLLTPITVDPAHPFPHVINKALCLAFLLRRRRRVTTTYLGVVPVPRVLPRLVPLPHRNGQQHFVFLADLVALHAASMYRGYEIVSAAAFRVTRNSNLYVQEEESRNLLETVRSELHNRRKGNAVRLEIDADADAEIIERLRANFELEPWQVFPTPGPVNLSRLMTVYEEVDRPELKFQTFAGRELRLTGKSKNLFDELRRHDILLHHPFDSFDTVSAFIRSAAEYPRVVSIKQTLYRTSEDSPIMESLMRAGADKEATVVVELKARFDEASNIRWARHLEDAGVQVFHGLVGLKTHCKLALLVRRDPDGVTRRYAHLGTGNYNPDTSRFYTDLSLLTCDRVMTGAVHEVFHFLTAYAERPDYDPLLLAPLDMAAKLLGLIERETEHARQGRPAHIVAKMNALTDKAMVEGLYRAAQTGVEVDLIVRGMCVLRPGLRGVSERIRVRSIGGRLLEHSRIFAFANGGEDEVYLGSADWMPRNLYDRVEVIFPLLDPLLRQRVRQEILAAYLADTLKSRVLRPDGTYSAPPTPAKTKTRGGSARGFAAQEFLLGLAEGRFKLDQLPPPALRRKKLRATPVG